MMPHLQRAKMHGHHVPHDEQTGLKRGRISQRSMMTGMPWYSHPFNIIGLLVLSAIGLLILACVVRACLQRRNRNRNRSCLLRCSECKHCRNHISELGRKAVWPGCPATITSRRAAAERIPPTTAPVVGWMPDDRPSNKKTMERGHEAWWKESKSSATNEDERCEPAQSTADDEMVMKLGRASFSNRDG